MDVEFRNELCVNCLRIFENDKLIYNDNLYFVVIYPPQICISQRFIKLNQKYIRNIIKIYNYEDLCFANINLVNTLTPIPNELRMNYIDGDFCYNDGKLYITIPILDSLSVCTFDYTVIVDEDNLCSEITLLDVINRKCIKKCMKSISLS